jgi:hypothetical protein
VTIDGKRTAFKVRILLLTPKEREAQPLAGGVFVCRPGVAGQPPRLFDG